MAITFESKKKSPRNQNLVRISMHLKSNLYSRERTLHLTNVWGSLSQLTYLQSVIFVEEHATIIATVLIWHVIS